jgi:hypothetical protein
LKVLPSNKVVPDGVMGTVSSEDGIIASSFTASCTDFPRVAV